jgi:hypothetical protein
MAVMKRRIFAPLVACLALGLPALADEGMWLFNQFPKERVKEKYGFEVTDRMLDHLRLASVKMGASGSFVSPNGLVFTNHHVGLGCVQRVSTPENNYVADGFLAAAESQELRCPGTEITVLQRIEDVTDKVKNAVKAPPASAEANRQRKAATTAIEEACTSSTGMRCEVVTLYSGARYHLYHLKRYDDVRLVFAPEFNVGFFGGDPDNFTYPRYCLDIAFFRAYENGKPAQTPNYLKWSPEGARDGELIFVSGHPAGSSRLATVAELEFRRDHLYPEMLARLKSRIGAIHAYGAQSPENERVGRAVVFSAENLQKRYTGFLDGLRDPAVMSAKAAGERKVREAVRRNAELRRQYGKAWDDAAAAAKRYIALHKPYAILETGAATGSDLFFIARTLVRLAEEKPKPNEQRLREYTDAGMPTLERRLYSQAAITDSFEAAVLAEYFRYLERTLGAGDATVKAVLAGRTAEDAARQYVAGSRLKDIAERRRLSGDTAAVAESKDTMIALARMLDAPARECASVTKTRWNRCSTPPRAASRRRASRFTAPASTPTAPPPCGSPTGW